MTVDRESRVGLMAGENEVDDLARSAERRIFQRPFRKHRCISGRDQQHVAIAQRNLEPLGKMQHHIAAGQCAAGLDKAQILRRDVGIAGKRQLAEMPSLPPLAQMPTDRSADGLHGGKITAGATLLQLPSG